MTIAERGTASRQMVWAVFGAPLVSQHTLEANLKEACTTYRRIRDLDDVADSVLQILTDVIEAGQLNRIEMSRGHEITGDACFRDTQAFRPHVVGAAAAAG